MSSTSHKKRSHKKHLSNDLVIEEASSKVANKPQNEASFTTSTVLNCNCNDHTGKEYLNQTFNLDFDYLFDCLFGFNQFHAKFSQLRKITGQDFFN